MCQRAKKNQKKPQKYQAKSYDKQLYPFISGHRADKLGILWLCASKTTKNLHSRKPEAKVLLLEVIIKR